MNIRKLRWWATKTWTRLWSSSSVYDDNTESRIFQSETALPFIRFNKGNVTFGDETYLKICTHNKGMVCLGDSSKITRLNYNASRIFIGKDSRIEEINHNMGLIVLKENCIVEKVTQNSGIIIGGSGSIIPNDDGRSVGIIAIDTPGIKTGLSGNNIIIPNQPPEISATRVIYERPLLVRVPDEESESNESLAEFYNVTTEKLVPLTPVRTVGMNADFDQDDVFKYMCPFCNENVIALVLSCGHVYCNDCLKNLKNCLFCKTRTGRKVKLYL